MDFRTYLQRELIKRCRKNPRYSLRAFSRMLGLEPSSLSKILNGNRRVSLPVFERLSERLGLGPVQVAALRPEGKLHRQRKGGAKISSISNYADLSEDAFEIISDWQHFAILELISVDGFKATPRWVAAVLGLSVPEVKSALERLQRTELLAIKTQGEWVDTSKSLSVARGTFTNAARKKLQRQILEKSLYALENVPREQHDHSSMTMAIDTRKLPEARKMIKRFRRELCELLKGDVPPRDQVYHLSVSLYPVTNVPMKGKSS